MAKSKHPVRKKVSAVKLRRTLRSTGKEILANPVVRKIFAAYLVHIAAGLVRKEATNGSPSRRGTASISAAGNLGRANSLTIGQVADTLVGYWAKNKSSKKRAKPLTGHTKAAKKKVKPDGGESVEMHIH
jgi:hypothetical protein